jgi:hypothetical protein
MDLIHRRIASPVLTELRLEGVRMEVVPGSVVPARLPDLFEGSPVVIQGRYRNMQHIAFGQAAEAPWGSLLVRGQDAAGKPWSSEVGASVGDRPMLGSVWARGRLRDLEDRYAIGPQAALEKEIIGLSLKFGVLCRFTSFVAVDRSEVVNQGGKVHGIVQPVEQPAGWAQAMPAVAACAAPAALESAGGVRAKMKVARQAPPGGRGPTKTEGAAAPPSPPARRAVESVDSFLSVFEDGESSSGAVPAQTPPPPPSAAPAGPPAAKAPMPVASLGDDVDFDDESESDEAPSGISLDSPEECELLEDVYESETESRREAAPSTPPSASPPQKDSKAIKPPSDKAKAEKAGESDIRRVVEQFLQELKAAPISGRVAWLRARLAQLESLVQAVTRAGVRPETTQRLEEARDRVRALLAEARPDQAAVAEVWALLEAALEECIKDLTPSGGRREGFWK